MFKNAIPAIITALVLTMLAACSDNQEQLDEVTVYEGPVYEVEETELWYSDSAVIRLMVQAAHMKEFENGDQEYPQGVYVEFYEKDTLVTSTLKSDQAFYTKETNTYRAWGNVKLVSLKKNQRLSTEELFWDVEKEEVYTEKFVIIETEDDVLHGEGLTAKQDFSSYRILKPTGELGLETTED